MLFKYISILGLTSETIMSTITSQSTMVHSKCNCRSVSHSSKNSETITRICDFKVSVLYVCKRTFLRYMLVTANETKNAIRMHTCLTLLLKYVAAQYFWRPFYPLSLSKSHPNKIWLNRRCLQAQVFNKSKHLYLNKIASFFKFTLKLLKPRSLTR